jgi:hypothetical protein
MKYGSGQAVNSLNTAGIADSETPRNAIVHSHIIRRGKNKMILMLEYKSKEEILKLEKLKLRQQNQDLREDSEDVYSCYRCGKKRITPNAVPLLGNHGIVGTAYLCDDCYTTDIPKPKIYPESWTKVYCGINDLETEKPKKAEPKTKKQKEKREKWIIL